MEDKELMKIMLEERKLATNENNEYGRVVMQLFTIFWFSSD